MLVAREERSRYLEYLPSLYREEDFLGRLLLIFEALLSPVERQIDNLATYFDPRLVPLEMLPWLASWLDVQLDDAWPEERRREVVAQAAELYRLRGTRTALQRALHLYTGGPVTVDEGGPHIVAVTVSIDPTEPPDETALRAIIQAEKPAHTAYLLRLVPLLEPPP